MSTQRALSTVAVASILVLSGLTAGMTGTVAAGNASGNTVFADQPIAYQSGADGSDTTVTEGESVTVDVPVTDGTIHPDTAKGEKWTHHDAPETVAGTEQSWTSDHAVGDRYIAGHVHLGEQRTIDEITVETGGNVSTLYIYPVGTDKGQTVEVTDGTATLSVSDVSTDEIAILEEDEETTEPLSIVDIRASNDGSKLDRSGWTAEFSTMKNIDVSEALDGDGEPWTSPTAMSDRQYAVTKVFSEEKRIDSLTIEHDGENYPSDITVDILSSNEDLSKTVSITGETTTIEFEAVDAKTVMVSEADDESSKPWAVTDIGFHKASSKTVESVRVDASELGAGTIEATRDRSGDFSATFTPNYLSVPDGTYTLPVTATDAAGNEYVNETMPITVDTQAPQFASQPQASDADGDGTVTSGETVTVTADFDTVEPTIESVEAAHTNVSSAPEAMDGDETPWTSEHPTGDRHHLVEVQFASEQTIDKIEIDTSGTSAKLLARAGDRAEYVSVTDGTATLRLDSAESAWRFFFMEHDEDSATRWTVSDLNAYHDGQQLDESEWSVETRTLKWRDVTSTFADESATWSARSSVGDNTVWFGVALAERTTIDEITIDHAEGATPNQLAVSSDDQPFLAGVTPESSTTTVEIPSVETQRITVREKADSTETDWAVRDLTISSPDNDDVERVTVDASALGAGTVEAEAVGPRTYEATIEPDSGVDGSYALGVTAVDEAGNTETVQTDEITVDTTDGGSETGSTNTGSTDDTTSNSDPSSSTDPDESATTGGGAIPVDSTERPEMIVETATANETTNVSITHARAGTNVTIERNGSAATANESASDETVALDAVRASVTNDGNYSVEITEDESLPAGAERYADSGGESAMGYVQVDHDEAEAFDDVTFEFRLSTEALADRGMEPGEVVLYRHSDGSWTPLDTSVVSRGDTWVAYEADSPGFSTFAVGAEQSPSISVTDAEVSAESLSPDDRVTVEATVENDGNEAGESTLALTLDGERALTEEVSVDAGETTTVTFETSVAETGQYDVAVDGTSAGTLSVTAETKSPTSTEIVTESVESDADGTGLVTVAVGVLVLLLLGAGAFGYARR